MHSKVAAWTQNCAPRAAPRAGAVLPLLKFTLLQGPEGSQEFLIGCRLLWRTPASHYFPLWMLLRGLAVQILHISAMRCVCFLAPLVIIRAFVTEHPLLFRRLLYTYTSLTLFAQSLWTRPLLLIYYSTRHVRVPELARNSLRKSPWASVSDSQSKKWCQIMS